MRPATDYRNYDKADPRYDDELNRTQVIPAENVTITNRRTGEEIRSGSPITRSASLLSDYYVISFSSHWRHDLFAEFSGADACFIVDNVDAFCRRLYDVVDAKLGSNWCGTDAPVVYDQRHAILGPSYEKPFRYALQSEHRFSWIPSNGAPRHDLEPMIFQSESMQDIARIVDIFGNKLI